MSRTAEQLAPLIYHDGPGHRGVDTSVAAAKSMLPHISALQARIIAQLRIAGNNGLTYAEMLTATGLTAGTICGRLCELAEARLIKTNGTRITPSGRQARVYVLAEFAP